MTKKQVKTTQDALPVQKKGNKWYNTITQRYVSHVYAKRINSYFLKHPEKTLHQARGHGVYEKEKSLTEHSKETRQMLYSEGTQIIKTKTKSGKKVFYSPTQDQILDVDFLKHLERLDYTKNNIEVELYRLTRDRQTIYHILTVDIHQRLTSPNAVDFWTPNAWYIFNSMWNEIVKILKKHSLDGINHTFGYVSVYYYSDLDGWEHGNFLKPVRPIRSGKKIMNDEFKKILDSYSSKLEMDSYHNIMVQKIVFSINAPVSRVSDLQKQIAKYRIGVTRIPYKKDIKKKHTKKFL